MILLFLFTCSNFPCRPNYESNNTQFDLNDCYLVTSVDECVEPCEWNK